MSENLKFLRRIKRHVRHEDGQFESLPPLVGTTESELATRCSATTNAFETAADLRHLR